MSGWESCAAGRARRYDPNTRNADEQAYRAQPNKLHNTHTRIRPQGLTRRGVVNDSRCLSMACNFENKFIPLTYYVWNIILEVCPVKLWNSDSPNVTNSDHLAFTFRTLSIVIHLVISCSAYLCHTIPETAQVFSSPPTL